MNFKKPHMEREWVKMVVGEMMLVPVVLYVAELSRVKFGKTAVVTDVFRPDAHHRSLMAELGRTYYPTVHSHWRGLDLRSRIYTGTEATWLRDAANERFSYGRGKNVAVYHDVGAGAHFHLQTPEQFGSWGP